MRHTARQELIGVDHQINTIADIEGSPRVIEVSSCSSPKGYRVDFLYPGAHISMIYEVRAQATAGVSTVSHIGAVA